MGHVDALSRNAITMDDGTDYSEIPILTVTVNEDDWVLSAQRTDKRCQDIHKILSISPVTNPQGVGTTLLLRSNRSDSLKLIPLGALAQVDAQGIEKLYQKELYDKKHASSMTFEVGQHVLVRKAKGSNDGQSRKLEPRYKGPFVITKVLDNDRYVVEELPGSKRSRKAYTGICPSERMKLFITVVSSDDENSTNE